MVPPNFNFDEVFLPNENKKKWNKIRGISKFNTRVQYWIQVRTWFTESGKCSSFAQDKVLNEKKPYSSLCYSGYNSNK